VSETFRTRNPEEDPMSAPAVITTETAAVVTETVWMRETPASRLARRGRRTNVPDPVFEPTTSRTGHYSDTCSQITWTGSDPKIVSREIVARNVPMSSADAGLPCEWCEPAGLLGSPVVAEAFDRFESRRQAAPRTDEPTEKQVGFLSRLLAERDVDFETFRSAYTSNGTWTKSTVSTLIDGLLATPKAERQVPAASPADVPAGVTLQDRPNRYAGRCVLCGGQVGEGAGRLGKQNGRWIVAHNDGECVERQTAETVSPTDGYEPKRNDVHFLDGDYYRIHIAQRSGRPYAVKACVECEAIWADDGKLTTPGEVDWDYGQGGYLRLLSSATLATAEQAAAFGAMVGRCCFCSSPIDTPESIAAGYGPTCADNRGLPWGSKVQRVG
jgi:hypothetical protein